MVYTILLKNITQRDHRRPDPVLHELRGRLEADPPEVGIDQRKAAQNQKEDKVAALRFRAVGRAARRAKQWPSPPPARLDVQRKAIEPLWRELRRGERPQRHGPDPAVIPRGVPPEVFHARGMPGVRLLRVPRRLAGAAERAHGRIRRGSFRGNRVLGAADCRARHSACACPLSPAFSMWFPDAVVLVAGALFFLIGRRAR